MSFPKVFGACSIHHLEELLSCVTSDRMVQEKSGNEGPGKTIAGEESGGEGRGGGEESGGEGRGGGETQECQSSKEDCLQKGMRIVDEGGRDSNEHCPGPSVGNTVDMAPGIERQNEEEEEEEGGIGNLFSFMGVGGEVSGDGVGGAEVRGGGDGSRDLACDSEEVKEKGEGDMVWRDGGGGGGEVSALKAVLQQRLLVMGREEELERQLKELFTSSSVTAQENLLLSLR